MGLRTFISDRGDEGRRLDHVLCRHLAGVEAATRSRVQRWIAEGAVTVNGRPVQRTSGRIAIGDVVAVALPQPADGARQPMQPLAADLDLLYEDAHLLAVNKPAGIVVHPTHAHATGTLMNALLWHARDWPSTERPSIVGRLDKQTSGIVVVAKSRAMHASLQRVMAAPQSQKDYLAVVYGRVKQASGKIDLRLARSAADRRRVVASRDSGSASMTRFDRLGRVPAGGAGLALLRCRLLTGRTHQIRAHLAASGWPIVGDPVYGEPRWSDIRDLDLAETLRSFPRQALHAMRLAIAHPATGARIDIVAPLPADMRQLLDRTGLAPFL